MLTGDGTQGEVYLADVCKLLVTHYEFGPNVYTKLVPCIIYNFG